MGIDGIGGKGAKGPGAPDVAGGVDKARAPGAVDKTFSVDRAGRAGDAAPIEKTGSVDATSPLARLRAGEIDVERYLDLKVDEATKPLVGLPPQDLSDIKQMLRDQLATDPGLVDLVKAATGKVPNPPQDE